MCYRKYNLYILKGYSPDNLLLYSGLRLWSKVLSDATSLKYAIYASREFGPESITIHVSFFFANKIQNEAIITFFITRESAGIGSELTLMLATVLTY